MQFSWSSMRFSFLLFSFYLPTLKFYHSKYIRIQMHIALRQLLVLFFHNIDRYNLCVLHYISKSNIMPLLKLTSAPFALRFDFVFRFWILTFSAVFSVLSQRSTPESRFWGFTFSDLALSKLPVSSSSSWSSSWNCRGLIIRWNHGKTPLISILPSHHRPHASHFHFLRYDDDPKLAFCSPSSFDSSSFEPILMCLSCG